MRICTCPWPERWSRDSEEVTRFECTLPIFCTALAAVDWVLSFADNTPERLLKKLKPDVLAKGGDYTANQVVGAPIVKNFGGEVKVLSLVSNRSTTAIVNKIQKQKK